MRADLKRKLFEREVVFGSWMSIGNTSIAEIMAQAGFEWITIDLEHSSIDMSETFRLIQTISLAGSIPLVRVSENSPTIIKRVMDAGAGGVIVPMVNTKEAAKAAVASVKYPPEGKRGVGLSRAQGYGFAFAQYKEWLQEKSVVIAQIEHIDAVNNLEAILSVPGIDGTIIGPYDLSASLGVSGQLTHKLVQDALQRYEEVCDRMGKPKGYHVVNPDDIPVADYVKKGYTFLAVGVDFLYLGQKCRQTIESIKG